MLDGPKRVLKPRSTNTQSEPAAVAEKPVEKPVKKTPSRPRHSGRPPAPTAGTCILVLLFSTIKSCVCTAPMLLHCS